ncbi:MAG: ribosomal RNA small subunit methyltransferase A [Candidatus Vogelbacteria bacterium CG22_combo_CG10-13_8_21_14_all_37_9]|uniref:Ribosomal RNA small subunit methyltransferase A n=1 Tax=Candidatus Vogelbacteria bacterium CG22_combo_CG10-13_8_21_14_all_37_9 TaxID=1975046 RepID=A0A2H0BK09_9BACT|nr:MAG: ribosomal RNA small subunit methyltransferase A [bacterium CG10_37_50]PIP58005.1 MAG: ribosomal RNA small subunit methyltransferase A [Candidatus Vogelbacteria bacterium CG22_combo_CG10-13_8_21_14_all_37_9]
MKAKKSLGQNWLISESAITKIVASGQVKAGDLILEIGPGQGILTKALLATGARVLAIEKDADLIPNLAENFSAEIASGKLTLINKDVLTYKFKNLQAYKLIANIPYYLTGKIIRHFLEIKSQPQLMVLMLQKEVAERIARTKKESLLSLSVKAYGEAHYIKTIPAGSFRPIPKVDSAILLIDKISRHNFINQKMEAKFFGLLRQGFNQKRKLLKNNLKLKSGQLSALGFDEQVRAEDLSLADWLKLLKI